jgi:undecaprenyl-diphosphatase
MPKLLRRFLFGLLIGLGLATLVEGHHVLIGRNFRPLIPGRVYRCSQPSDADLNDLVRRHGIRTVVNLRGCWPNMGWYAGESRATAALDIAQEDLTMSAGRLPAASEIRRLVEILENAEYPLVIHCRRGVDRTGLACALTLLLGGDATLDEAREQLGFRHGHIGLGRTEAMLDFFDLYEAWLKSQGLIHSRDNARRFALSEYRPGPAPARLEFAEPPVLGRGTPGVLVVRATNLGAEPWELKPGTGTGIHLRYHVRSAEGKPVTGGVAGLLRQTIPVGGSITLTIALPPLPGPAVYRFYADMHLTGDVSFAMLGSEPLETELTIP